MKLTGAELRRFSMPPSVWRLSLSRVTPLPAELAAVTTRTEWITA